MYSTEMVLLKLTSDIWDATDSEWVALLVLLDVSMAFDTIDQDQLIKHRMRNRWLSTTGLHA